MNNHVYLPPTLKKLRDTLLRSQFKTSEMSGYVGAQLEFTNFENRKIVKEWFNVSNIEIDDDYECNFKVCFEL